jgi:hypothetical protein
MHCGNPARPVEMAKPAEFIQRGESAMAMHGYKLGVAAVAISLLFGRLAPRTMGAPLQVGPGREFSSIAAAVHAAHPGDIIQVWPLADNRPYRRAAVLVTTPRITI